MSKRKNVAHKPTPRAAAPVKAASPKPETIVVVPAKAAESTTRAAQTVERVNRRAAERQQRQRKARNQSLLYALIGAVVVGLLGYFLYQRISTAEVGEAIPQEGQTGEHVAVGSAIPYLHNPPASGPHYPSPLAWTSYPKEQPAGYWVHNLEHGGIVMLYNCPNGCDDLMAQMQSFEAKQKPGKWGNVKLVRTPYARLPEPNKVIMMAWNHQLAMTDFDAAKAQQFYDTYVDKGPEDVP